MAKGARAEKVEKKVELVELAVEDLKVVEFKPLKKYVCAVEEETINADGTRRWKISATPNGWDGPVETIERTFTAEEAKAAKIESANGTTYKDKLNNLMNIAMKEFGILKQSAVGHQMLYGG